MRVLIADPELGLACINASEIYFSGYNLTFVTDDHIFEFPMTSYQAECLIIKAFTVGHLDMRDFTCLPGNGE